MRRGNIERMNEQQLSDLGATVGALLKKRGHSIAVGESSAGGLISAALVAVPGASAYYLGGAAIVVAAGTAIAHRESRDARAAPVIPS